VIGFSVYESSESDGVAQTGVAPMRGHEEKLLGGHAVLVIGYDDTEQRFIVRNSWGKGWGQAGYFTMPYAYLMDPNLSDDFWTVRLIAPDRHTLAAPLPDLVLGPADHGSTQRLALGQRLVLRLPEVPTSGYRWQGADALAPDGALRLVSSDHELPALGAVGGQGMRCMVLEACAPGQVGLHLQQSRAGAAGAPTGHFELTVHVHR
jgi:predicted secreted protein